MVSRGWGLVQPLLQVKMPLGGAHLMSPVVERASLQTHFRHDLQIVIVGPVALIQQERRDIHALLPLHNAHGTGKRGWRAFQRRSVGHEELGHVQGGGRVERQQRKGGFNLIPSGQHVLQRRLHPLFRADVRPSGQQCFCAPQVVGPVGR